MDLAQDDNPFFPMPCETEFRGITKDYPNPKEDPIVFARVFLLTIHT